MLPLDVPIPPRPDRFGGGALTLTVPASGVLTLLGPNGSGKSQVLRALKEQLASKLDSRRHVVMLAAGRLLPLESRRLLFSLPHGRIEQQPEENITLGEAYKSRWHQLETAQGVLNRLEERPDLQIKVGERLRALFGREMELGGDLGKLKVEFARGGAAYPSAKEASGLLHLVAILAALYDDELAAVLIDEPGISLHPQYQAFLRREMERAAGDPATGKKVVVCATHAPAMVRLRRPADLCGIVFFRDIDTAPVQVDPANGALQNRRLGSFVRSLGASHREALFAARPLLVEGPSDELVVEALDEALDVNLHASGGHVVQAVGKGSMPTALKLLQLIGKEPAALADLDGFTDGPELVQAFNNIGAGREAAAPAADLRRATDPVRDELAPAVERHWVDVEVPATAHAYWTDPDDSTVRARQKRRTAAAVLLRAERSAVAVWPNGGAVWGPLRDRLVAALDLLEVAGLFVLRHGTVEGDYVVPADRSDKVGSAAAEADAVLDDPAGAAGRHGVALRALRFVSPALPVDESAAVRVAFESVVAPAVGRLRADPNAEGPALQAVAARHAKDVAGLFDITRVDGRATPTLRVSLAASVLDVEGFPVDVEADEDVVRVAGTKIQPKPCS